jgi:hypothetical protein
VELLESQKRRLAEEAHALELRRTRERTYAIAQELKVSKEKAKEV